MEFNEASFDESATKAVETTSRILRDYVAHFFSCVTCREHFVSMYDSCSLDRCNRLSGKNWRELPLWLFETHNAVNIRLAQERMARMKQVASDIQSARWPKIHDCRLCWIDKDGNYDHEIVYLYLKHEYGQRSPSTIELRRQLANTTLGSRQGVRSPRLELLASNSHFICFAIAILFVGLCTSKQFIDKQKIE